MKYAWLTIKHKWYVFLACLKIGGIPLWRAIIHDWRKFTPAELPLAQRQFFGNKKSDPAGWARAFLHHWNFNPHHYQYWIDRPDHSEHYRKILEESGIVQNGAFEMPEAYVREMVADWMGASIAYTGSWDMTDWLSKNLAKMKLHPKTRSWITRILQEMDYPAEILQ